MKSGTAKNARLWVCCCMLVLLVACGSQDGEPAPGQAELVEIPYPNISGLEEQVQIELREARELLESALLASGISDQALAGAYGETGVLYHAHTLRDAAEACYRNARVLAPDDMRWPYYLGLLYKTEGDVEPAVESFERVLEIQPDSVPALIRLGQVEFEANRHDRAAALFRRAQEIDPASASALVGLGRIALAGKDYAGAVESLERALQFDPKATEVYYPLGLAYRGLGDEAKAMQYLEERGKRRAKIDDPLLVHLNSMKGGWRLHQNQGTVLFRDKHYEAALAEFRKAEEMAPEEAIVHINIGTTLSALGNHDGARLELQKAVELDPESPIAHFDLGTIAARFGDDTKAIGHYEAALRYDPEMLSAHLNLANAQRRAGRFEQAGPHYRHVVEGDPTNGPARLGEALVLIRLGLHEEARQRLEEAQVAVPGDRPIRHALARVLAAAPDERVRDGERAMALAKVLVEEENNLFHVEAFAMAAAEVGRFDLAVYWQNRAIEAVRQSGRDDVLPVLQKNLRLYEQSKPSREPWPPDSAVLSPTAASLDAQPF